MQAAGIQDRVIFKNWNDVILAPGPSGAAFGATLVLLGDELSVPAQQRVRRESGSSPAMSYSTALSCSRLIQPATFLNFFDALPDQPQRQEPKTK